MVSMLSEHREDLSTLLKSKVNHDVYLMFILMFLCLELLMFILFVTVVKKLSEAAGGS